MIGILAYFDCIPSTTYWSAEHTASQVQSLLICVEMMCASIWHMSNNCFGYAEFAEGSGRGAETLYTNLETTSRAFTYFGAVRDTFQPTDTLFEMKLSIEHSITRIFLWWHGSEPVAPSEDVVLSTVYPQTSGPPSRQSPGSDMMVENTGLLH